MSKFGLFVAGIFSIFVIIHPRGYAKNHIYPVPPPNDTGLLFHHLHHKPAQPHFFTRKKHKIPHPVKVVHHKNFYRPTSHGSFYVYYALPASACCGETWVLKKINCCAHSGVWQTSPYATFKLSASDFIYNATNNDDERGYDWYRDVVANEIIEDPRYY